MRTSIIEYVATIIIFLLISYLLDPYFPGFMTEFYGRRTLSINVNISAFLSIVLLTLWRVFKKDLIELNFYFKRYLQIAFLCHDEEVSEATETDNFDKYIKMTRGPFLLTAYSESRTDTMYKHYIYVSFFGFRIFQTYWKTDKNDNSGFNIPLETQSNESKNEKDH